MVKTKKILWRGIHALSFLGQFYRGQQNPTNINQLAKFEPNFTITRWRSRTYNPFFKGKALGTRLVVGDEKVSSGKIIKSKSMRSIVLR